MTWLVLTWPVLAIVLMVAAHFALRRHYGTFRPFWAWIEHAWWACTFVCFFFASVQLVEKSNQLEMELAQTRLDRDMQDLAVLAPITRRWLDDDRYRPSMLAVPREAGQLGGTSLGITLQALGDRQERWGKSRQRGLVESLSDLCPDGPLRRAEIGGYDEPVHLGFYPVQPTPAQLQRNREVVCTLASRVGDNAAFWLERDSQRRWTRPFVWPAAFWYFPLAVGFALKLAKNIHEAVRVKQLAAASSAKQKPVDRHS